MDQKIAIALGLVAAACFPATSFAQVNPECKDKLNEVRLKNGTKNVIQGAVDKYDAGFGGSDAYYPIQPNETRCWPRPRRVGQLLYWFKDGGTEVKLKATAGDTKTYVGGGRVRDGG